MEREESAVVFVVPGDLHLTEPGLPNHRVAEWVAEEVNALVRPDFVQFIGDNVQDATDAQFALFGDLAARLRVPWYALVGDHDAQGDALATRFRQWVGKPTGATALGGCRFLRLNTQEGRPVGLSPAQAGWFLAEVDEALALHERVIVFQHNYPYKVWETFDGPGIDDWRTVVQTRRITAIFTGRTHYGQAANDGRNVVVAARSIGDPEGGRPGYLVGCVRGEDLAVTYRTEADDGPLVLITHPRDKLFATGPAHVVRGADPVRARVWSAAPLAEVLARLDSGPWLPLEQCGPLDWAGPLSGAPLARGEHYLQVRAVDALGKAGAQVIEFMVDPTGRFTAVPAVRPPVLGTQFC